MAIELGAIVPMPAVARSAGRTGGAEGAQGSGSFASALSASNAAAPADTASATPRGLDRKAPAHGRGERDKGAEAAGAARPDPATSAGTDGIDPTDATDATDAAGTDADAAALAAAGAAPFSSSATPQTSPAPSDLRSTPPVGDAQSPPTQPDPSGSALLLAQSALGSAAAQASSSRMPGAVSSTAPALQGVPSVAAGPALRPGEAPGVPGTGAMAGTALAGSATVATSEAAAAAASAVASAVAVAPGTAASTQATVVGAVTGEPDVPAPVAGAARNPALRAASGPASDVAASVSSSASPANPAVASAPTAAQAAPVDSLVAPSATAASAAASSAAAQQAQRAVAQAVADRAAQQAPVAGVASGRGATDLSATAALAGASAGGESSPLLRRFERVLSMTHAALGDAAAPGGGTAFAASAFTTPVDAAGASAGVASGAADRSADAMNGWLAQVVAQKNQNASLTVEVGGRPVSVDVQVKGNEAQVVFRADQADTRALLAQAMPQLRQMMGAEGVVLADASVAGSWGGGTHAGAGGAGGSGGSGGSSGDGTSGRGTAPVRLDAGTASSSAATAAGAPTRPGGARSLDLYV